MCTTPLAGQAPSAHLACPTPPLTSFWHCRAALLALLVPFAAACLEEALAARRLLLHLAVFVPARPPCLLAAPLRTGPCTRRPVPEPCTLPPPLPAGPCWTEATAGCWRRAAWPSPTGCCVTALSGGSAPSSPAPTLCRPRPPRSPAPPPARPARSTRWPRQRWTTPTAPRRWVGGRAARSCSQAAGSCSQAAAAWGSASGGKWGGQGGRGRRRRRQPTSCCAPWRALPCPAAAAWLLPLLCMPPGLLCGPAPLPEPRATRPAPPRPAPRPCADLRGAALPGGVCRGAPL